MSIEARAERIPRRAGDRWRGPVGFAVSIAIHAGLGGLLMLFVASSEPQPGLHPSVPIDFIQRPGRTESRDGGAAAFKSELKIPRAGAPSGDRGRWTEPRQMPSQDRRHVVKSPTPALMTGDAPEVTADMGRPLTMEPAGEAGGEVGPQGSAPLITGSDDPSGSGNGSASGGRTGEGTAGNTTDKAENDRDAKIAYAMNVRRMLERRGAYPKTARRLGLEGEVVMLLKIDGSGTLVEITVTTSSGFGQLDEAAMASARRMGPLPTPPGGRPVEIMVPVSFSMRLN